MGMKVLQGDRLVDSDLILLDTQVRDGDAVAGWRGDETMWVNFDPVAKQVQVFGIDSQQRPYLAAACPQSQPGFRHVLLAKLVKGDWQHRAGNLVEDTLAANAKVREDAEKAYQDWFENEGGPKLHHAFVKDGAAPRQDFYMTPRKERRP